MKKTHMRISKILALLMAVLLAGCDAALIEEDGADYSISIEMPYATATPAPAVVDSETDAIVITSDGDVVVKDPSAIEIPFGAVESESQYDTLSLGSEDEAVKRLEERLYQLNYFSGTPDEVFDEDTQAACHLFESTYTKLVSGVATPAFQAALFDDSAPVYGSEAYYEAKDTNYMPLQKGDASESVLALQQRLRSLGYPVEETGAFDDGTASAVCLFFNAYGFEDCFVATVAMQKALFSDNARAYQPAEGPETDASYQTQDITIGSSGSRVAALQAHLMYLGYPNVTVTGVYQAMDSTAVALVQKLLSLAPNGIVTEELYDVLLSSAIPAYADAAWDADGETLVRDGVTKDQYGIEIQRVQMRLLELGYAEGTTSGRYDEAMIEAVRRFQKKAGLPATGELTGSEMSLLYADFAPGYSDEVPMDALLMRGERDVLMLDTYTIGHQGRAVYYIGARLARLGYLANWYTDLFDEQLAEAVRAFQRNCGIPETGEVAVGLYRFLASPVAPAADEVLTGERSGYRALALDENDYDVRVLQRAMMADGLFAEEHVNGKYDENTRLAVSQVERMLGYGVTDGIAGEGLQAFYLSDRDKVLAFGE